MNDGHNGDKNEFAKQTHSALAQVRFLRDTCVADAPLPAPMAEVLERMKSLLDHLPDAPLSSGMADAEALLGEFCAALAAIEPDDAEEEGTGEEAAEQQAVL